MRIIYLSVLLVLLSATSCSKKEKVSPAPEKEQPEIPLSNKGGNNSKIEVTGNWEWISGSVDHPPFFLTPESTPWYKKTLTFDESFHYKLVPYDSSAKAPRDSGTYRILDTLTNGRQTSLIYFYSGGLEKNKYVLPISLTGNGDSLLLFGGFSSDRYKKIPLR
ncbi:MAG: hypothetical protein J7599_01665 [Niabella sp.]|nr:hypothetical protein [Niabella sp.]